MTSTQMPQEPPPMPKTELSPKLASLANATEPHNASNQQQSPVGTFPQRPTGTTASPPVHYLTNLFKEKHSFYTILD